MNHHNALTSFPESHRRRWLLTTTDPTLPRRPWLPKPRSVPSPPSSSSSVLTLALLFFWLMRKRRKLREKIESCLNLKIIFIIVYGVKVCKLSKLRLFGLVFRFEIQRLYLLFLCCLGFQTRCYFIGLVIWLIFWFLFGVSAMQTEALPLVNRFQLTEDLDSVWVYSFVADFMVLGLLSLNLVSDVTISSSSIVFFFIFSFPFCF